MSFPKKKKQGKALWTQIKSPGFSEQQSQLRPEKEPARALKFRSNLGAVMNAIYLEIADLFKLRHPWCQCCALIRGIDHNDARLTTDVHHVRGRDGLLLFDVRWYKAACRPCHVWIGEHPKEAVKLKLLAERGEWGRIE